jgi:hypothetical protein
MKQLSKIKRLRLRDVWDKEASDFTPWLAENIDALGEALGMDLELQTQEAAVGDFSLDLLAKDLGSNRLVVVENQLTQTDHDHLGKLLTYAGGFDAAVIIWVSEAIRDEHRQALDWLNQRTDAETEFFGVVIEVLQIDNSAPAFNFRAVVFPNDWQKRTRSKATTNPSSKGEAYRQYFQPLIDELRETHRFTGARVAQPQSWYAFSIGTSGVPASAVFAGNGTARVELYIDVGDATVNKTLFGWLHNQKEAIEKQCGFSLQWERLDDRRACRIFVSRPGSIDGNANNLADIRKWQIEKLLIFKKVFAPLVKAALKQMSVGELASG